jgi:hypothetical protein
MQHQLWDQCTSNVHFFTMGIQYELARPKPLLRRLLLHKSHVLYVYFHFHVTDPTPFTLYSVGWLLMWMLTKKYMSVILYKWLLVCKHVCIT